MVSNNDSTALTILPQFPALGLIFGVYKSAYNPEPCAKYGSRELLCVKLN